MAKATLAWNEIRFRASGILGGGCLRKNALSVAEQREAGVGECGRPRVWKNFDNLIIIGIFEVTLFWRYAMRNKTILGTVTVAFAVSILLALFGCASEPVYDGPPVQVAGTTWEGTRPIFGMIDELVFTDESNFSLTSLGDTAIGTYTVDGNKITLLAGSNPLVYTLKDDILYLQGNHFFKKVK